MGRHDFEPAKLLAGLVLLAAGIAYVLDGLGEVDLPGALPLAMVPPALCLAGLVGAVTYGARRRSARRGAGPGRPGQRP
ncbi:hypothetical protein [Streptomyces sp. TP-A0874]|uniref:hypothetical protein n=1 Tax=Streptomyces sp. TP-A0874 TaxID=549819 RepID=UPI0008530D6B|nr:hypothetical protein [Streptomyces sp. TP-A0874]